MANESVQAVGTVSGQYPSDFPIDIAFSLVRGRRVFASFEDLHGWLAAERAFWQSIGPKPG
jgi:hypothetical protein